MKLRAFFTILTMLLLGSGVLPTLADCTPAGDANPNNITCTGNDDLDGTSGQGGNDTITVTGTATVGGVIWGDSNGAGADGDDLIVIQAGGRVQGVSSLGTGAVVG